MGAHLRQGALVGVIALVLSSAFVVRSLSEADFDPTLFTGFGEEAQPTRDYAEARLGEVLLRPGQGHDGKSFFVQANDPWILEPDENAMVLDSPLYRSQRMLYPLLAGGAGVFGPETIAWGLIVVNVVAFGVGTFATAVLAGDMGMSPWLGLGFLLNLGLISELLIDGAGVTAAALAFAGVLLLLRRKTGWAAASLAGAALARETMLIAAAGSALWLWRQHRRREAVRVLGLPLGAVAMWWLYLRLRIGFQSGPDPIEAIGWPLVGFVEATQRWQFDPMDLVAGMAIFLLLLLYAFRVLTHQQLLGWAFLGFVPLGLVLTRQVWQNYFDIARAIAPVITASVLVIFTPRDTASQARGADSDARALAR